MLALCGTGIGTAKLVIYLQLAHVEEKPLFLLLVSVLVKRINRGLSGEKMMRIVVAHNILKIIDIHSALPRMRDAI